jgi:hypothetical protein
MDSENSIMVSKEDAHKVMSISIIRGCELSETARAINGISKEDMIELRVERNSPAEPKIIKLGKNQSPTSRFTEALKKEGFLGKKIL